MTTTIRVRLVTLIDNVRNTRAQVEGLESDRWDTGDAIADICGDLAAQGHDVDVVEYDRTWGANYNEVTVRFEDRRNDHRALRVLVVETYDAQA